MKQIGWKIVLFIVSIGALLSIYELVKSPELLVMMVISILLLVAGIRLKSHRGNTKLFCIIVGFGMMVLTGMQTIGMWITLAALMILFIFFAGKFFSKVSLENLFNQKKTYRSIETIEPSQIVKRTHQQWIGEEKRGNDVYEWDDINITTIAGDTIIDIGNTILPNEENIIIIRKGVGRIRVIVPIGVGIALHHSTLIGEVEFLDETTSIKNETIEWKSPSYYQAQKKIKIYTSIFIGNLEVIEL